MSVSIEVLKASLRPINNANENLRISASDMQYSKKDFTLPSTNKSPPYTLYDGLSQILPKKSR